ncbi:IS3 family transposase (plasmid) [Deinococcus sp. KNUC1210]|uniref:IS3 family transposase n=1 Tax=Deinococcus sp. KNUC1210 TaxID=2917691 RepID=UPI001EF090A0|nr:IS3 family transposase [Deinococcus sp. KNUC1210]ULH17605.1 IS3 family transposase [Deinococcus sp. KNUC1210]
MTNRRMHSAEFKRDAIQLARTSGNLTGTARDLGINASLLRKWMNAEQAQGERAFPGQGKQSLTPEQQEIQRLRRENEILRQEREILKKAGGLLCQRNHPLRYQFILEHRGTYRLDVMCRVLEVSVSGYHRWRRRPVSTRTQQDALLQQRIRTVHLRSKRRYGAPRVHAELRAEGLRVARKRVARLMRLGGLRAKGTQRRVQTTDSRHTFPVCPNRLGRQFKVSQPNQVWASDITYLPTREGWLYLAVTLDLHSRAVVGDAMDAQMPTALPLAALHMAIGRRCPPPGLLHHSDRGSQFASRLFQEALARLGAKGSMSRAGDCWDNAVVESFFGSLKRELYDQAIFETRLAARQAVFEFIEVFYNRQRRHSTLGYLTPLEFERQAAVA